jgi:hypothetical protein
VERDQEIGNEIPDNSEYLEYFAPEFTLRPELPKRIENMNSKEVDEDGKLLGPILLAFTVLGGHQS